MKNMHKFQPRSKPREILGYPAGYKMYKVLDLETNITQITRNVVFHEDIFPFANDTSLSTSDLFSLLDNAVINESDTK